jgi:hypothetical protein
LAAAPNTASIEPGTDAATDGTTTEDPSADAATTAPNGTAESAPRYTPTTALNTTPPVGIDTDTSPPPATRRNNVKRGRDTTDGTCVDTTL